MSHRTYLTTDADHIPERTTQKISFLVQDEDKVALAAADLTTLTVTLYNKSDAAIINSRDDLNILNANGGTVDASGNGAWVMTPADNQIVTATKPKEHHVLLFEWTYNAGADSGRHEVEIIVVNLTKVS